MKQHWEVSAQESSIIYVLWGYFSFINITNNRKQDNISNMRLPCDRCNLKSKRLLLSSWPHPHLALTAAVCFLIWSVVSRLRWTAGRCWLGNKDRSVVILVLVNGARSLRSCTVCVLSQRGGHVVPGGQRLILRSYLDTLHLNGFEQDWCLRLLCMWGLDPYSVLVLFVFSPQAITRAMLWPLLHLSHI